MSQMLLTSILAPANQTVHLIFLADTLLQWLVQDRRGFQLRLGLLHFASDIGTDTWEHLIQFVCLFG